MVGGETGTVYVSNQRLSAGLSAFQISAIVAGDLIASQPWVTEQIDAIPAPTPTTGPSTFTQLASATLSAGGYSFPAVTVANALIDGAGNYKALLIHLEDFSRHQNNWRIPLGVENYGEGVDHEFYHAYVNNGSGAIGGMNLAIRRNTGATPTATLFIVTTGVAFDAGTNAKIYGEA